MREYMRALSLLLSLSLTRSHYIRDGKTFQTETSIQIIEKDDFVESKIIPRVCTHEVEAELGLAACPLEVPSTLSAVFLEDRPGDAEPEYPPRSVTLSKSTWQTSLELCSTSLLLQDL